MANEIDPLLVDPVLPRQAEQLSRQGMPMGQFQHTGLSWSERARLGELRAVWSVKASRGVNLLCHGASVFAADLALRLACRHQAKTKPRILDYGFGTGRFLRYFGIHGVNVVGVDITPEMLTQARKIGLPKNVSTHLTDGITIPLESGSVDLIWVCGVLKYTLFPPGAPCRGGRDAGTIERNNACVNKAAIEMERFLPVYRLIAQEMFRVLKCGGFVVNYEMFADAAPSAFTKDFQDVGFATKQVRVVRQYRGRFERLTRYLSRFRLCSQVPSRWFIRLGKVGAACRYRFDNPMNPVLGMRDYLFIWRKPYTGRRADSQT